MELAIAISLHVFFSLDFPGVKRICYVRSVIATVPAVPEGEVSGTTWREWQGCVPGGAGPATRAFTPGRPPSDMSGTCIAECAATWTCSAFRASMGWACSLGCIACFAFPRIAVPRAGTAFSHFGFTAESSPRSIPWNHGQSLIPSPTSVVSPRNWCIEPANPSLSASGAASRRLILSLLHIRMEFDLFKLFEFCLDK